MNIEQEIKKILSDSEIDNNEKSDNTRCDLIEALIPKYSWNIIQEKLITILLDDEQSIDSWTVVAEVIWGALLDKRQIKKNKIIALLYYRLNRNPDQPYSNNLLWSITSKLKNTGYLSDYNPWKDQEVIEEIKKLERT